MTSEKNVIISAAVLLLIGALFYAASPDYPLTGYDIKEQNYLTARAIAEKNLEEPVYAPQYSAQQYEKTEQLREELNNALMAAGSQADFNEPLTYDQVILNAYRYATGAYPPSEMTIAQYLQTADSSKIRLIIQRIRDVSAQSTYQQEQSQQVQQEVQIVNPTPLPEDLDNQQGDQISPVPGEQTDSQVINPVPQSQDEPTIIITSDSTQDEVSVADLNQILQEAGVQVEASTVQGIVETLSGYEIKTYTGETIVVSKNRIEAQLQVAIQRHASLTFGRKTDSGKDMDARAQNKNAQIATRYQEKRGFFEELFGGSDNVAGFLLENRLGNVLRAFIGFSGFGGDLNDDIPPPSGPTVACPKPEDLGLQFIASAASKREDKTHDNGVEGDKAKSDDPLSPSAALCSGPCDLGGKKQGFCVPVTAWKNTVGESFYDPSGKNPGEGFAPAGSPCVCLPSETRGPSTPPEQRQCPALSKTFSFIAVYHKSGGPNLGGGCPKSQALVAEVKKTCEQAAKEKLSTQVIQPCNSECNSNKKTDGSACQAAPSEEVHCEAGVAITPDGNILTTGGKYSSAQLKSMAPKQGEKGGYCVVWAAINVDESRSCGKDCDSSGSAKPESSTSLPTAPEPKPTCKVLNPDDIPGLLNDFGEANQEFDDGIDAALQKPREEFDSARKPVDDTYTKKYNDLKSKIRCTTSKDACDSGVCSPQVTGFCTPGPDGTCPGPGTVKAITCDCSSGGSGGSGSTTSLPTLEEPVKCKDASASVSYSGYGYDRSSVCQSSQNEAVNVCEGQASGSYNSAAGAACDSACARANPEVPSCKNGNYPPKPANPTCKASACQPSNCGSGTKCSATASLYASAVSIQCKCGASGGGSVTPTGSGGGYYPGIPTTGSGSGKTCILYTDPPNCPDCRTLVKKLEDADVDVAVPPCILISTSGGPSGLIPAVVINGKEYTGSENVYDALRDNGLLRNK